MRLFKSQKTRGDRAKLFINLNSAHVNKQKTPIPILASDQKFIFVKQCYGYNTTTKKKTTNSI